MVGDTGDPAAPYEGARRTADEPGEGTGVLLTWKGPGHAAYGSGSVCVDSAIDASLLRGAVHQDGKISSRKAESGFSPTRAVRRVLTGLPGCGVIRLTHCHNERVHGVSKGSTWKQEEAPP